MQITLDTDSPKDLQVLKALVGVLNGSDTRPGGSVTEVAKNATAAPKRTPKVVAENPVTAEPVTEEETPTAGATMKDAVALATTLVANGKAKDVKAALEASGASRVTELADDAIAGFIADALARTEAKDEQG